MSTGGVDSEMDEGNFVESYGSDGSAEGSDGQAPDTPGRWAGNPIAREFGMLSPDRRAAVLMLEECQVLTPEQKVRFGRLQAFEREHICSDSAGAAEHFIVGFGTRRDDQVFLLKVCDEYAPYSDEETLDMSYPCEPEVSEQYNNMLAERHARRMACPCRRVLCGGFPAEE